MSGLLKRPKKLAVLIIVAAAFIIALAGGALGDSFGLGFLGAPIAHIQLPAESVMSNEMFLGWEITNTMIATWLTIVVLVVLAFFAQRRMTEVPRGLQNLFEVVIEFFLGMAERVSDKDRARRFFPLVMTIFLFIVTANWMGILPGFGTIGRLETAEEVIHHAEEKADDGEHANLEEINLQVFDGDGFVGVLPFGSVGDDGEITAADAEHEGVEDGKQAGLLVPFLRSANTDINTTLAIALVAMFVVHLWGLRTLGFFGHLGKFINFKSGPIGAFVGILEGISEIARIISFTFRLFGNIFAGEVLLVAMAFLIPIIGIIPFLGLELFVGMIQAFIFAMLTLVFATMATVRHGAEEGH